MRAPEEVSLPPGSLVLADLHLDPAGDAKVERFVRWLDGARDLQRLVVLGDLFDVWVGAAQARLAGASGVLAALARRARAGLPIDVVPGNRDFLLDADFERRSGARLRPAGMIARLPGGEAMLCLHGDELCTRDLAYQRMKRVLRSGVVRSLARALPLAGARWAAERLRRETKRSLAAKPAEEKEMQAAAADEWAGRHAAQVLVCGHAHRHRDQVLPCGARWVVLDAWEGGRDVLAVAPDGSLELGSSLDHATAPVDLS